MKGVPKIPLSTLLSEGKLEYVNEVKVAGVSIDVILNVLIQFEDNKCEPIRLRDLLMRCGLTHNAFLYYSRQIGSMPAFYLKADEAGAVYVDLYNSFAYENLIKQIAKEVVEEGVQRVLAHQWFRLFSEREIEEARTAQGSATYLFDIFKNKYQRLMRPSAQGVTLKKFLVMYGVVFGVEISQQSIKEVMTLVNEKSRTVYMYKTKAHIENHYAQLKITQRLGSCMTKGSETLRGENHRAVVEDKKLLRGKGYRTVKSARTGEPTVFTPNIACFNHSPNLSLYLLSNLPPDEVRNADKYPFFARAIGTDCGVFVRAYGRENSHFIFERMLENRQRLPMGSKFRAYIMDGVYTAVSERTQAHPILVRQIQRYLKIPYVDGGGYLLADYTTKHIDEVGRAYYEVEIISTSDELKERGISDRERVFRQLTLTTNNWLAMQKSLEYCVLTDDFYPREDLIYVKSIDNLVSKEHLNSFIEEVKQLNFNK